MIIKKINSLTDVMHDILIELENGGRFSRNSSDYYEIASDEDGHTLSVSVTLEHGPENEGGWCCADSWYSIHAVDEISGEGCDLHITEDTSETALLYELVSILRETMDEIIK